MKEANRNGKMKGNGVVAKLLFLAGKNMAQYVLFLFLNKYPVSFKVQFCFVSPCIHNYVTHPYPSQNNSFLALLATFKA